MNKHSETSHHNVRDYAEGTRALMAATADVSGEKVAEARKRVAIALERAKGMVDKARGCGKSHR